MCIKIRDGEMPLKPAQRLTPKPYKPRPQESLLPSRETPVPPSDACPANYNWEIYQWSVGCETRSAILIPLSVEACARTLAIVSWWRLVSSYCKTFDHLISFES